MDSLLIHYPVDLTGRNPTNLIMGEPHFLVNHSGISQRVVVLDHGGFYTRDLMVYDKEYNRLKPNIDYVATYTYEDATFRTGLEICGALVFLNPELDGMVYVTAQMVGGDYAFSLTAQEDVIEWISTNVGAPITWGGITGVQRQYLPGELKAELWERDGFQSFNNELEALVNSKIAGNQEAANVYRSNARELQAEYLAENDDRLERHVNDDQDPHDVTKRQVGLELVENFPVASEAQARGGILHEAFMVPQRTHQAIDELALKPLTAHVARKDNPHGATYGQVGVFGKVEFDAEVAKKLPRDGTAADWWLTLSCLCEVQVRDRAGTRAEWARLLFWLIRCGEETGDLDRAETAERLARKATELRVRGLADEVAETLPTADDLVRGCLEAMPASPADVPTRDTVELARENIAAMRTSRLARNLLAAALPHLERVRDPALRTELTEWAGIARRLF